MTDDERRAFRRVPARLIAHFRRGREGAEAVTENVSLGGVFIETSMHFDAGSRVYFDLHLPIGATGGKKRKEVTKVAIAGTVRWRQEQPLRGVGIEIDEITTNDRRTLRRFIRQEDPDALPHADRA